MIATKLYSAATQSFPDLLNLVPGNPARVLEFNGEDGPMHAKAFLLLRASTIAKLAFNARQVDFVGVAGAGTYNVSPNSWDQHIETMFFTRRPNMVQGLYELYLQDIANSKEVLRGEKTSPEQPQ